VSKQQHAVDRDNVNNGGPIYECGDAMRARDAVSRRSVSVLPQADVQMAATVVERPEAIHPSSGFTVHRESRVTIRHRCCIPDVPRQWFLS
jgi:hypothetical protein